MSTITNLHPQSVEGDPKFSVSANSISHAPGAEFAIARVILGW